MLRLFAVAIGLLLALEGVRAAKLYRDLSLGRALLVRAETAVTQQTLATGSLAGLDAATADLQESRSDLQQADGMLETDPLVRVASYLPLAGRQIATARNLTSIGLQLTDAGLHGVEAARRAEPILDAPGSSLPEKLVPTLEAVKAQVAAVEADEARIRADRSRIADSGLLPPLRAAVVQLDARNEPLNALLRDYDRGERLAPTLLGYRRPQTYLILAHDNSEIFGSQGLALIYGFLSFDRGRMTQLTFGNVQNIAPIWPPPSNDGYIMPPPALQQYLLQDWPMGLAEASWWPDFPTEARNAIDIYHTNSKTSTPIDGVVGVNFFMLQKLLQVTGPLTVESYGQTVTSADVIEKTLLLTNPQQPRPGEPDKYAFAEQLAKVVIQRAVGVGPSQRPALLAAIQSGVEEKDLLLYSSDAPTEQEIASLGLDGGVRPAPGDYLMLVDSSIGETKVNLALRPSIDLDVRLDGQGRATDALTVRYDLPYKAWSEGKDPWLVRLLIGDGQLFPGYVGYLRVLAPLRASLTAFAVDGRAAKVAGTSSEFGKTSMAYSFALPLDRSTELHFTYGVPEAARQQQGTNHYQLMVQKEPGIDAVPLTVTVHVPRGDSVRATRLRGSLLAGAPSTVTTDLRQDCVLDVEYGPSP